MPTTYALLCVFSVTINCSVGAYFFVTPILEACIKGSRRSFCQKLLKLYEEKPDIARKLDELFSAILFVYGLYLLASADVLNKPFVDTPQSVLVALAIDVGHYTYKTFQDCILHRKIPLFKINLLHHIVTIATYIVFIYYRQNAISGVIGLLFEGSVTFLDLVMFLRALGVRTNDYAYICLVFTSFLFTVVFRAIAPILLLITALLRYNPLLMDYFPLGIFFMNIVFFSMVNGWLAKSSFESLRRRIFSRRIINELARARGIGGVELDLEGSLVGMELNNMADNQRTSARQPLTMVNPANESFRLAPPVSNVNMDSNSSVLSNLTISKHERTLPRFNMIVNDSSSTTDTELTSGASFV